MARQLTFDLAVRESRSRGDFFVSEANAQAIARLEATETWPNKKLILIGPEGAGKTHLAHVWSDSQGGEILTPKDLEGLDITSIDKPMVFDGADDLTEAEEEPMFHLHNHMAHRLLPFLIVARQPAALWRTRLPDLRSRMEAADSVRIAAPDDALLAAVLVKLFSDRQLVVAPPVIDWLVRNMDRSFQAAKAVVAALDKAALEEGRAVTRPLAQKVLSAMR
ncbi:MAG: chromosomal replication initiator DnaA [Paracoccaceae bacterium]|nr:chromosomal replication initiator DnaA [Paracoccaceae bacterium]